MMKKPLILILLGSALCLVGCGNGTNCPVCSCSSETSPADAGGNELETGAYVFKVKDSVGNPVSGAEFTISVVRNIPGDTWINTVGEKYIATSDSDGDVSFTLNQLENIETGGDYGLLSMSDVEDKTPSEYKTVTESGGMKDVSGLYYVDAKGGVYTGSYTKDSYGEYKGYYLHYSYAGEEYTQHAIHQYDLKWTWERTLNGLFSTQVSHREWDEDAVDYVRKYQEGGHIKVTMNKAPEGYSLMSDSKNLSFSYATSGDAYDKYCHTANYVFVSESAITL